MNINEILRANGLITGRMISFSKSDYRDRNPNSVCYFNANIVTAKDGESLKAVAEATGEIIYVLREMDGRFEHEDEDGTKLIQKAVWDTTQEIPINN
jgi:hypothetical protein